MAINAVHLHRGQAVYYKNGIWACVQHSKVEKGKGDSYYSIQLRNLKTQQLITERFRTKESFDLAHIDRKAMEYLYEDGMGYVFMDPDTYDQVSVPSELLGEQKVFLVPNMEVQVAFCEGTALTAELPVTVELTVVDTPPVVKGATATNQPKEALCEGGARVRVPPFVDNGTVIKVDTRTGEYLSRV